jgi:hypothetical protein
LFGLLLLFRALFVRRRAENESLSEHEYEQDQHDHDQDTDHQVQRSSGAPAGGPATHVFASFVFSPPDVSLSIHRPLDLVADYVVHSVSGDKEYSVRLRVYPQGQVLLKIVGDLLERALGIVLILVNSVYHSGNGVPYVHT